MMMMMMITMIIINVNKQQINSAIGTEGSWSSIYRVGFLLSEKSDETEPSWSIGSSIEHNNYR